MSKTRFCLVLLFLSATLASAQDVQSYGRSADTSYQRKVLSYLADDSCAGRAAGSQGCSEAAAFIVNQFRAAGLNPRNWVFTQSFRYNDSIVLRNIVGVVNSDCHSDEYIIVCAHYDHLGKLGGTIYNGADDNASGVTALISLARMFKALQNAGQGPHKNILFVALDGKELNCAGSEYFVSTIDIPRRKITCAVNIDIIGNDLVPVWHNKEYIIALGEETLPYRYQGYLQGICHQKGTKMDLDLSFYGSRDFTKMMYGNGDHHSFAAKGIPAVFFTSGFHQHTYKPTDDADIINFSTLHKRTLVMFSFINALCQ